MNDVKNNIHVTISAFTFNKDMVAHPRRIETDFGSVNFQNSVRSTCVISEKRIVRFFSGSDGTKTYLLKNEGEAWMLLR